MSWPCTTSWCLSRRSIGRATRPEGKRWTSIRRPHANRAKALTGVAAHLRFCGSAFLMVLDSSRRVCAGLSLALGIHGVPEQIMTDSEKVFTGLFQPARSRCTSTGSAGKTALSNCTPNPGHRPPRDSRTVLHLPINRTCSNRSPSLLFIGDPDRMDRPAWGCACPAPTECASTPGAAWALVDLLQIPRGREVLVVSGR